MKQMLIFIGVLVLLAVPGKCLIVPIKANDFFTGVQPIDPVLGAHAEIILASGNSASLYITKQGLASPTNFDSKFDLKKGEITTLYVPGNYGPANFAFYANDEDVVVEGYAKAGDFQTCQFPWCAVNEECLPISSSAFQCISKN